MKAVKRFFGGKKRRKKHSTTLEGESQPQPQSKSALPKPSADPVTVPANNKKSGNIPSSKENKNTDPSRNDKEVGDKTKTEKSKVKSAPIKASEVKQEGKEVVSVEPSDSDSKIKNTQPSVVDRTKDPSGNRGSQRVDANQDSEKSKAAATPTKMEGGADTKSPSKSAEKKIDSNGTSPSLFREKVDEVVVPQSGIEDRHSTISRAYDSIPLLEQTKLPRGGISIETEAVGRVQVSNITDNDMI